MLKTEKDVYSSIYLRNKVTLKAFFSRADLAVDARTAIVPATLALALVCSSCTLGPDFVRPASPQLTSYAGKDEAAATFSAAGSTQSLAPGKDIAGQWWRLFRSPELTQLIEQAIKHSPDLQAAYAALTEARENASANKGALLPAFSASFSDTRQQTSGALFGNPNFSGSLFTLYDASVNVSYTLDVFGGIQRQIEALNAQADYRHFQLEAAFLTLAGNIVTTVVQEASLRAQIAATEEIIKAQAGQLEIIKQQFNLGGQSKVAVLAQQSALEQARTGLPPLQQQLSQARHRLSVLLGDVPGKELAARFNLTDLHLPEQLPLSLPSNLVRQRPDIRAQENLLHAASAQIGVVTASVFPNFTLNASASSIATHIGDLFIPGSAIWSLGGNLLQPLFRGGEFIHKRRAAIAAYEQAAAQYRSTVLQAFQNVVDTLAALKFDAAELTAQNAAEQTALATLETTRAQFQIGAVSYLALLTAERDYQQAHIGRIKAQAARLADTAALFQALGGGWWNRADVATVISTEQNKLKKPCQWWFCLDELIGLDDMNGNNALLNKNKMITQETNQ